MIQEVAFLMPDPCPQNELDSRDAVIPEGLISRARKGEGEAVEELVGHCQKQVLRLCRYLMDRPEDAADAAQETLLKMLRRLGSFDERRPLAPWLYRLTANTCRDLRRRQRRRAGILVANPEVGVWERIQDGAASPSQELEAREKGRLLRQALAGLTARERRALVLRDLEGLSTREVAGILGSSPVTIRVHIASARRKIRAFWRKYQGSMP